MGSGCMHCNFLRSIYARLCGNDNPFPSDIGITFYTEEINMADNVEEVFRLTPKGYLAVRTNRYDDIDEIWDDLAERVKSEAAENGMTSGTPCLVFEEGGRCITINKEKVNE